MLIIIFSSAKSRL